jgi:hypothetical protein
VFYHTSDGLAKFWPSSQNAKPTSGLKEWSEAKKVVLPEAKDDLSKLLRLAEKEEVLIIRHGKPAGILIEFESEDDWFGLPGERSPLLAANRIGENQPALLVRDCFGRYRQNALDAETVWLRRESKWRFGNGWGCHHWSKGLTTR